MEKKKFWKLPITVINTEMWGEHLKNKDQELCMKSWEMISEAQKKKKWGEIYVVPVQSGNYTVQRLTLIIIWS